MPEPRNKSSYMSVFIRCLLSRIRAGSTGRQGYNQQQDQGHYLPFFILQLASSYLEIIIIRAYSPKLLVPVKLFPALRPGGQKMNRLRRQLIYYQAVPEARPHPGRQKFT